MEYPEHEKLRDVQDESQSIGFFIESLAERGLAICELADDCGRYYPSRKNINELLAEHFEIDLVVLEKEKQAMLDALGKQ